MEKYGQNMIPLHSESWLHGSSYPFSENKWNKLFFKNLHTLGTCILDSNEKVCDLKWQHYTEQEPSDRIVSQNIIEGRSVQSLATSVELSMRNT